ncbi:MAG: CHAP domain-containing protein, partial [Bacteroidota bacterium]
MPRSSIISVLVCLTCSTILFAATPKDPASADPIEQSLTLPKAPSGPTLAPSPDFEPLPAPERRRIVVPAPAPAIGQVALKNGQQVHYPKAAVTASAIVKIATRQVSSVRNRCARTMREALGWGLGDAHQWVSLEKRGFSRRKPGEGAQPGDIIVWPFTFGSRGTQHIGVAVGTSSGTRLLSNLSGSIEISQLAPGYRAYYKPLPAAEPRIIETGCLA